MGWVTKRNEVDIRVTILNFLPMNSLNKIMKKTLFGLRFANVFPVFITISQRWNEVFLGQESTVPLPGAIGNARPNFQKPVSSFKLMDSG